MHSFQTFPSRRPPRSCASNVPAPRGDFRCDANYWHYNARHSSGGKANEKYSLKDLQGHFDDVDSETKSTDTHKNASDGPRTISKQLPIDTNSVEAKNVEKLGADGLPVDVYTKEMLKTSTFWLIAAAFFLNQFLTQYVGTYWKVKLNKCKETLLFAAIRSNVH